MTNDFWGYVLKLPVDTELARVRGVVGYNLPKWLTEIRYNETNQSGIVVKYEYVPEFQAALYAPKPSSPTQGLAG